MAKNTRWVVRWIDAVTGEAFAETCSTYRVARQFVSLLKARPDVTNLDLRRESEPFDIW